MRKNKYPVKEVFVGKLKPLNEGTYSKEFIKRTDKPLTKVYVFPNEQRGW